MKCSKCGAINKEDNLFCFNCGSKLEDVSSSSSNHNLNGKISCPECGVLNSEDNTYCFSCGSALFDESNFKKKNAVLSAIVSFFIPGAGYFYLGYSFTGIIILSIYLGLVYLVATYTYSYLIWLCIFFIIAQVIDSTRKIGKYNNHELVIKKKYNLWTAMFMSLYIRGLGLAYLGYYKRFFVVLIISVLFNCSHVLLIYELYILEVIFAIYVLYDTYACFKAKEKNEEIPLLFGFLDIK